MKKLGFVVFCALAIQGCTSTQLETNTASAAKSVEQSAKAARTVNELYEVHDDGRIYLFYDKSLYDDFKHLGHAAYRQTRIGAGPNGETLVFVLTGADKKKLTGIPSVDLLDGKREPGADFYGEVFAEGRTYVFDSYDEMKAFRSTGEAAYRYTDIGGGKNGETVVYVLRKAVKKKKPVELMAAYKAHNQ